MSSVTRGTLEEVGEVALERNRVQRLARARRDLWYVAGGLGYHWDPEIGDEGSPFGRGKGLTTRLHQPICQWMDARLDRPFIALFMSRWFHKTTIVVCRIVQEILRNPNVAILYWHAVEAEALKVLGEVAHHIKTNEWLRSLDPISTRVVDGKVKPYNVFPRKDVKKFETEDKGFTIRRPAERFSRFATLFCRGAGSEVTGAHGNIGFLDDTIARNDIEDNQLAKKKDWYENTVLPVIDDMRIVVTGTPWSDWGMYQDWCGDPEWCTLEIPAATVERIEEVDWSQDKIRLTPDYEFEGSINYGYEENAPKLRKKLRVLKRQMKSNFGPQIMVDPVPKEEKPWSVEECEKELFIPSDRIWLHPGTTFILSDPAPLYIGSDSGENEKKRADGSKDEWAIAAVRITSVGDHHELYLLDGIASREWGTDEALELALSWLRKWRTSYLYNESFGGLQVDYSERAKKIALRMGITVYFDPKTGRLPRYADAYMSQAKNHRFTQLAWFAKQGWFRISSRCSKSFLEDQREPRLGFLYQAREWRPLHKGRNSLQYDDRADVVARGTDSALINMAPIAEIIRDEYEEDESEEAAVMSRYCGV